MRQHSSNAAARTVLLLPKAHSCTQGIASPTPMSTHPFLPNHSQTLAGRFLSGEVDVTDLPSDSLKRIRDVFRALRAAHQVWGWVWGVVGWCWGAGSAMPLWNAVGGVM